MPKGKRSIAVSDIITSTLLLNKQDERKIILAYQKVVEASDQVAQSATDDNCLQAHNAIESFRGFMLKEYPLRSLTPQATGKISGLELMVRDNEAVQEAIAGKHSPRLDIIENPLTFLVRGRATATEEIHQVYNHLIETSTEIGAAPTHEQLWKAYEALQSFEALRAKHPRLELTRPAQGQIEAVRKVISQDRDIATALAYEQDIRLEAVIANPRLQLLPGGHGQESIDQLLEAYRNVSYFSKKILMPDSTDHDFWEANKALKEFERLKTKYQGVVITEQAVGQIEALRIAVSNDDIVRADTLAEELSTFLTITEMCKQQGPTGEELREALQYRLKLLNDAKEAMTSLGRQFQENPQRRTNFLTWLPEEHIAILTVNLKTETTLVLFNNILELNNGNRTSPFLWLELQGVDTNATYEKAKEYLASPAAFKQILQDPNYPSSSWNDLQKKFGLTHIGPNLDERIVLAIQSENKKVLGDLLAEVQEVQSPEDLNNILTSVTNAATTRFESTEISEAEFSSFITSISSMKRRANSFTPVDPELSENLAIAQARCLAWSIIDDNCKAFQEPLTQTLNKDDLTPTFIAECFKQLSSLSPEDATTLFAKFLDLCEDDQKFKTKILVELKNKLVDSDTQVILGAMEAIASITTNNNQGVTPKYAKDYTLDLASVVLERWAKGSSVNLYKLISKLKSYDISLPDFGYDRKEQLSLVERLYNTTTLPTKETAEMAKFLTDGLTITSEELAGHKRNIVKMINNMNEQNQESTIEFIKHITDKAELAPYWLLSDIERELTPPALVPEEVAKSIKAKQSTPPTPEAENQYRRAFMAYLRGDKKGLGTIVSSIAGASEKQDEAYAQLEASFKEALEQDENARILQKRARGIFGLISEWLGWNQQIFQRSTTLKGLCADSLHIITKKHTIEVEGTPIVQSQPIEASVLAEVAIEGKVLKKKHLKAEKTEAIDAEAITLADPAPNAPHAQGNKKPRSLIN